MNFSRRKRENKRVGEKEMQIFIFKISILKLLGKKKLKKKNIKNKCFFEEILSTGNKDSCTKFLLQLDKSMCKQEFFWDTFWKIQRNKKKPNNRLERETISTDIFNYTSVKAIFLALNTIKRLKKKEVEIVPFTYFIILFIFSI